MKIGLNMKTSFNSQQAAAAAFFKRFALWEGTQSGRHAGRKGDGGIIATPHLIGQLWLLDREQTKKKKRTQQSLEVVCLGLFIKHFQI